MKATLIFCHVGVAGMVKNRPAGDREGSWIGHGIASIGAYAKSMGHEIDLIDMRNLSGFDELKSILEAKKSPVYGISVSAVDHWPALKTVLLIKKCHPDSKIIVGGIHPTIFPDEYDYDVIDTIVQGEGEVIFSELLDIVENGGSLPKQCFSAKKPDLDAIPWIDRELFDYGREMACNFAPDQKTPSVTMLAGRGCSFKCSYCQPAENAVFGHPFRMRSPENVVSELKSLKRYGYKSITFWDDTFTFRAKWVREFCDLYEQEKIGASIAACSRADIICNNEGMIERLSEIGLDWLVIGFESGSQRILDLIKKGTTVEQNLNAAKICKKYGIKIFGTFMFGLPTETENDSLDTARMIDEIGPNHSSPFWFLPIKGTDIYKFCDENDLILDETKKRTIERTGTFVPTIKGINYDYITKLMQGYRGIPGSERELGWC